MEDLNFVDGTIFVIEAPKDIDGYRFELSEHEEEQEEAKEEEIEEDIPEFNMKDMLNVDLGERLVNTR